MIKKIPVAVSLEFLLGVHGSGTGRDKKMNLSISGKRLAAGLIWPIGRVACLFFGCLVRFRVCGRAGIFIRLPTLEGSKFPVHLSLFSRCIAFGFRGVVHNG